MTDHEMPADDSDAKPICTLRELATELGASRPDLAACRKRVYKDTDCGASLGINCLIDGRYEWSWDDSLTCSPDEPIFGIALSGYVEGTDAECPVHRLTPGPWDHWRTWIKATLEQCEVDADDLAAEIDAETDE